MALTLSYFGEICKSFTIDIPFSFSLLPTSFCPCTEREQSCGYWQWHQLHRSPEFIVENAAITLNSLKAFPCFFSKWKWRLIVWHSLSKTSFTVSILLFPQPQFLPPCLSSSIPPQQCPLSVFFHSSSWTRSPPSQTRTAGLSCWGVSLYVLFAKVFCMLSPESWIPWNVTCYFAARQHCTRKWAFRFIWSTSSQGTKHGPQHWEKCPW